MLNVVAQTSCRGQYDARTRDFGGASAKHQVVLMPQARTTPHSCVYMTTKRLMQCPPHLYVDHPEAIWFNTHYTPRIRATVKGTAARLKQIVLDQ